MHSNYRVKWLSMYKWISGYELLEIVTLCWICLSTLYTDECDASGQSYIMVRMDVMWQMYVNIWMDV